LGDFRDFIVTKHKEMNRYPKEPNNNQWQFTEKK